MMVGRYCDKSLLGISLQVVGASKVRPNCSWRSGQLGRAAGSACAESGAAPPVDVDPAPHTRRGNPGIGAAGAIRIP